MNNVFILDMLKYTGMLNIEEGINIWHLLNQVLLLDIPGEVVELGCYNGHTAALLGRTLEDFGSSKRLCLFDSFSGQPAPTPEDGASPFREGSLVVPQDSIARTFAGFGVKYVPEVFAGWFKDTLPEHLPDKIAFAHIDCDFYAPVLECLENIYPRLSKGAVVVVDDYYDPDLHPKIMEGYNTNVYHKNNGRKFSRINFFPGVKLACDEFFSDKPEKMSVLISADDTHAYFRKA
jgi:O-methyltransferase